MAQVDVPSAEAEKENCYFLLSHRGSAFLRGEKQPLLTPLNDERSHKNHSEEKMFKVKKKGVGKLCLAITTLSTAHPQGQVPQKCLAFRLNPTCMAGLEAKVLGWPGLSQFHCSWREPHLHRGGYHQDHTGCRTNAHWKEKSSKPRGTDYGYFTFADCFLGRENNRSSNEK